MSGFFASSFFTRGIIESNGVGICEQRRKGKKNGHVPDKCWFKGHVERILKGFAGWNFWNEFLL